MINRILDTYGFSCTIWVVETGLQWHLMVHSPEIKFAYEVKCQKKFCITHNEDTWNES